LSGFFVPLALLLLAPIVVNIILFHTILSPGLAVPLVILILGLVVAYDRKENFKHVLVVK
jgi:putative oxidoreductase